MAFYVVQFLTGLASASSLFLVASGLSIIFGVTRIVNFAHGAFYMLGAFIGKTALKDGKGIMVDTVYRKGADYLPSDEEVAKLRPKE